MSAGPDILKPLDDFFRALMRHHDFCMKQKAAEADLGQTGPKEPDNDERRNAKCLDTHD